MSFIASQMEMPSVPDQPDLTTDKDTDGEPPAKRPRLLECVMNTDVKSTDDSQIQGVSG